MDEALLPIGQLARLGRLSIKQLRHYDKLRLLVPAYVDEHTGSRYYRYEQARDALSIGLLRSLDVPLAVIARVLSDRPGVLEGCTSGWKPSWPSADRRWPRSSAS
jgi:DNA-binding transcriptional MerR regulator